MPSHVGTEALAHTIPTINALTDGMVPLVHWAMSRLTLTLLGGFEVQTSPGRPLAVPTRKAQALLAYLALTPGQAHPRDKLAALLWGELSPGAARNALRQSLFLLRKALGEMERNVLAATGDAVTLPPGALPTDVVAFERAVAEASPAALERAAALYRGDLLAGLGLDEPAFEDWLMSERERLRELALEAFARLLVHQRASGAAAAGVQTALRLLALDPLQEAVHRALMRLYGQLGRRDAALRQYQECVEVLHRELDVEPELETKELYQELLRQRPVRAEVPPPASAGSFEAPLVGRDMETRQLLEALGEAWAGHGRLAAVLGEAGIGKSRLLAELAAEAGRRGGAVLVGRAYESEQILPFGPWVDAVREGGVLVDARSLDSLGIPWLAELARLFPELTDAGLPAPADARDHLRLFEALARLLRHLALPRPLLVVLEDVHWADDMSLRFLAFIGRRLHEAPVLVAVSAREEELADSPVLRRTLDELAGEQRLDRLTLARLGRDDTMALVRALGRVDSQEAAGAHLGEQVWEASAGNPFIVVETVRAIRDGVTVGGLGSLPCSTRVRDMIARRLDRLGPRGRPLASVAAVIGREFDFALLQRAAGLADRDTAEGVEELVRRRVLRSTGQRLDFNHDRIREVAYLALLPPHRRVLHDAVARALEALHAADLEPHYGALAAHYREAEVWDRAVHYLARFADSAARRYAHAEAAVALDEALRYVERLPGETQDRRVLDLVFAQARLFHFLGRFPDLVARLGREEERLTRVGEPALTGPYYFLLGQAHSVLGDRDGARYAARRAIEEAQRCDDRATMGKASTVLAREAYWLGRPLEGIQHGRRAVRLLEKTREAHWLGMAHWLVGRNYYLMGEFDAALMAEDRARVIGEAIGDLRVQSHAAMTTGEMLAARGDWEAGIALCGRAVEIAPDPLNAANAVGHLGSAYLEAGDAEQAIPRLERARRQFGQFQGGQARGWYTLLLGAAHLARGDLDEARALTLAALEILEAARYRRGVAWARRTLGRIAQQAGALGEAEARLQEALATFTEVSARFEMARTHLALAEVAHRRRDVDSTGRHLDDAHGLFSMLAVPRYVERARRMAEEMGVSLTKGRVGGDRERQRFPWTGRDRAQTVRLA